MTDLTDKGNNFLTPDRPALEITAVWVNPNASNLLAKITVTNHRWGQTLVDCSVVRTRAGGYFVFPPAAPMVGRDGVVLKDQAGKTQYKHLIVWSKEAGRRFSEAVVRLLKASHPELFGAP
jgi:hypothetical protein